MPEKKLIQVAEPALVGNERQYVLDCIDGNWISSAGEYVQRFEEQFARFAGTRHALACSNGTVALHLALLALDIGPGDEVIVPSMTFVATANAVTYCGARPIFADSRPESWNIDPTHVETLISSRTKAIIAVHLFGLPADMEELQVISDKHGVTLIEDAAEAHGANYFGRPAGSLGKLATFSFYGNKILTTGEGGMVTTDDDSLAEKVYLLKGQGLDPNRRYWHPVIGYNYRLTNIAAAIGLAQLEKAEWHLERRREIASVYRERLSGNRNIQFQDVASGIDHSYWMSSIVLRNSDREERDRIMRTLKSKAIETRPFFVPMHLLPIYSGPQNQPLPVAEYLGDTGFCLPSGALLSRSEQEFVIDTLLDVLEG